MGAIADLLLPQDTYDTDEDIHPYYQLMQAVTAMRDDYATALPPHLDIEVFMRDARTAVNASVLDHQRNPKRVALHMCDHRSVLGALMSAAQLGLRPAVGGEAVLVPRYVERRGCHMASLDIGYKGYVKLAYATGSAKLIYARPVYERDLFKIVYGTHHALEHEPEIRKAPGEIIAFYAYVRLPNGLDSFLHRSQADMLAFRDRYATDPDSPWWDDVTYPAMGCKTILKRLAGSEMPLTGGAFAEALAADRAVRLDTDPTVPAHEASEYLEQEEEGGAVAVEEEADAEAEGGDPAVAPPQGDPE